MDEMKALVSLENGLEAVVRSAATVWADSTTRQTSLRRADLLRDKFLAVSAFFVFTGKHPAAVTPVEVRAWRSELERGGLKPATVYARLSRLSSFYEWAMKDAMLGEAVRGNPVRLARPKAPRAYQTERVRSLTDEQVRHLVALVRSKAEEGNLVAMRDYALLLLYLVTGMRRSEIISLRGRDLEEREGVLIMRGRVKGSDYVEREVRDHAARAALVDYLSASGRLWTLKTDAPLWTRHDRAGKPGAALTSHAFARNLKLYGKEIGLENVHVHQTRHTYARMVAEETGSIIETQDALGHRHASTTRVYVQRITVKRDKHSERISSRLLKN